MFDGCSNLSQIGEYIEWYDPVEYNSYLYVKESDETKCNTAGQQAEVNLFVSVPYLQEEYDSFTGLTDLTKMVNIFKGTGLLRTPKGFLKNADGSGEPALAGILAGSSIKFFNPDLMSGGALITNLNSLFVNTQIIAIPSGFMSNYPSGTVITVYWYDTKSTIQIAYIPKTFCYGCSMQTNLRGNWNNFAASNVRIIQNDWASWSRSFIFWNEAGTWSDYSNETNVSFNQSNLVNIPRNFMKSTDWAVSFGCNAVNGA